MNMFSLKGKIALITGGNGGLGFAMAKALLHAGANVAICGRQKDKLNHAQQQLGQRCTQHRVDLGDDNRLPHLINDVVDAHKGLDILVSIDKVINLLFVDHHISFQVCLCQ